MITDTSKPPLVRVAYQDVQDCDGVLMRIIVLECGHILVRAPEWALHDYYRCYQCEKLIRQGED